MAEPIKPLLDGPAAAARLGITERQLKSLRLRREIPFLRVGARTVRYDPDDIDAWLAENRTEAVS